MFREQRGFVGTSAESLQHRQPPAGAADPQQRPAGNRGTIL